MGTVEKFLARINNEERLRSLLHDLGRRHASYNAEAKFIPMMGNAFITAIKPYLEEHWNEDVDRAWHSLFSLLSYYMTEGMIEGSS
ncbi:DgyrCDS9885 [Dimorphilus gyrociliatus]|uniref:DgyrCDS9885 n=1 Tax=Dimorphilus gyrociliatus TaxID=2664684 RepID=A0A7I8W0J3_9ANNE|nr:DgyrCDS9885 [Dimorphilus gyrociliatus]